MSLHRIASKFYGEVWGIRSDVHASMGRVLQERMRMPEIYKAYRRDREGRGWQGEDHDDVREVEQGPVTRFFVDSGIALVSIEGVIGKRLDWMESACGGYDLEVLDKANLELMGRGDVHTVVHAYKSPGGFVTGVQESADIIRELAQEKRVVSFANLEACSAAFWLFAAADERYASPTGTVGCVGTYAALLDDSRAWEMEGLKLELFRDGPLKAIGHPGKAMTDEERVFLQGRTDEISALMKGFVRERLPGVDEEALRGQWMSGNAGLEAGLVDGLFPTLDHLLASLI
jgi:ClpP class serine protease